MRILLATDGSDCSNAATDLLKRLPLPPTCYATVLMVLENVQAMLVDTTIEGELQRHDLRDIEDRMDREASRVLEIESQKLDQPGWTIDKLIARGHVAHQIIEKANELGAELIVVGAHGMGRIERFLVGSVSRKVVEYAPCAVLVVRPPQKPENPSGPAPSAQTATDSPLRIVLALDGSAAAQAALDSVAQMAPHRPIRVTIARVLALSRFYRIDILERMTDSWQMQKQVAGEQVQAAGKILRQAGAEVCVELCEGSDVSHQILSIADRDDTDIIVAGHTGRSGVERFLLGSVSRRLVCHANCSVWIHRER